MIRKNIVYAKRSRDKNLLDVIYQEDSKNLPVLFFIHGGGWMTGGKDLYTKLGENFLVKGFISVIINYRLYPLTDVFGMAEDCADAFNWCIENIREYGGDPDKIFFAGHSAGGHLAAVTGLKHRNPDKKVKGLILIDAFGLCAHYFLSEHQSKIPTFFAGIFGREKSRWDQVSPDKLLHAGAPPFLLLTGGSTYPYISFDTETFAGMLVELNVLYKKIVVPNKTHMQIIYEFERSNAKVYSEILNWIGAMK